MDGQGPVAGARVWLGHNGAWIPARGRDPTDLSATTDAAGDYVFDLTSEWQFSQLRWPARLRAVCGLRVSCEVIVQCGDPVLTAPDLALMPGVMARVRARWDDGKPAKGVHLLVFLQDRPSALRAETEHPTEDIHCASGETDENGEMPFGPAPDHEFARVSVWVTQTGGTRQTIECAVSRLDGVSPLDIVLARGREVMGTLRTAEGAPAAGFRVAPFSSRSGDPETESVVTADSTGRFRVKGVELEEGGIAVYDRLPKPPTPDELATMSREQLHARMAAEVGGPMNPLLFQEVPDGRDDVGIITLPRVGTLTLRLTDSKKARPLSGRATWMWSGDHCHGSRSHNADAEGVVRIEPMPLGIRAGIEVHIEDSRHGMIEGRFVIPKVGKRPVKLRVTGAGTVVVRLHPSGAPTEPLTVGGGSVVAEGHVARENGLASELRGWTRPGFYPTLRVGAQGFRERVIEGVTVRDDGPTYLDVELEPL